MVLRMRSAQLLGISKKTDVRVFSGFGTRDVCGPNPPHPTKKQQQQNKPTKTKTHKQKNTIRIVYTGKKVRTPFFTNSVPNFSVV